MRKVCSEDNKECTLQILQSDCNLYTVLADMLLFREPSSEETEYLPATFRDAVKLMEMIVDANEDPYQCALLAHEIKQVYEARGEEL